MDTTPDFMTSNKRKLELQLRLTDFICRHFSTVKNLLEEIALTIIASYSEGTRFYHSLQHIARRLRELDAFPNQRDSAEKNAAGPRLLRIGFNIREN